ncbi:MAG: copper resistance D family protein [Burkholderiales bacterium]
MHETGIFNIVLTAADLMALMACIGLLTCCIWVLPAAGRNTNCSTTDLSASIWKLLGACIAALTASSIGILLWRALDMSGQPFSELASVLPVVLQETHFGKTWWLRPLALALLWFGWWNGRGLNSRALAVSMWGACALIALSRSLSGHAADGGDFTLPELSDWVHLLAGSVWAGGLLVFTLAAFQALAESAGAGRRFMVEIVRRFSSLASIALAAVLVTGICNTWIELGALAAFWETAYGRILLVKLLLVLMLVVMGASNRYRSIPLLRDWAMKEGTGNGDPSQQFVRKVLIQEILMLAVIFCVAFLVNAVPGHHLAHASHSAHQQ